MAVLPIVICFQSLVLDMAGNVGTQSLAVTIRVLMDETLTGKQKLFLLVKEMKIGLLNGGILGIMALALLGIYIHLFKGYTWIGAFGISGCVGISLLVAMVISSLVGTVIPMFFHKTKTVLLATGAGHRKLGVPGEETLAGAGVSYCATCDGAFFRNKTVAVVGGGDVALEDALYLAAGCEKVYLIHRRQELRGTKVLQEQVANEPKITFLPDTVVKEICGEQMVDHLVIANTGTGEEKELPVSGIFIAVGMNPQTDAVASVLDLDHGYVRAGEDGVTEQPGLFVAGDVRTKKLRQIVTAVADGANSVTSIVEYLKTL